MKPTKDMDVCSASTQVTVSMMSKPYFVQRMERSGNLKEHESQRFRVRRLGLNYVSPTFANGEGPANVTS